MTAPKETNPRRAAPGLRFALELGPLLVFFLLTALKDIYWATGVFMVLITISVITLWVMERKPPKMPIVTAGFVLVFGGLTFVFADARFIKMKPTIVNVIFAAVLFGGLAFGRSLLQPVLGHALKMTDRGWKILTLRWAIFFVVLAIANEIVWRNFDDKIWAGFKFAIVPLTFVFMMTQVGLMTRHAPPDGSLRPQEVESGE